MIDYKYTIQGIYFFLLGIIMVVFHNSLGNHTINFREKLMKTSYDENIRKFTKIGFVIIGTFFATFGALIFFHKI